jgi:hypothetical protein
MQPVLDRGGMRWTWLRGRETMHKRYLLHVAGHNLSLFMSRLIGVGKSTTLLFPDNRFRLPTTVSQRVHSTRTAQTPASELQTQPPKPCNTHANHASSPTHS